MAAATPEETAYELEGAAELCRRTMSAGAAEANVARPRRPAKIADFIMIVLVCCWCSSDCVRAFGIATGSLEI